MEEEGSSTHETSAIVVPPSVCFWEIQWTSSVFTMRHIATSA